MSKGKVSMDDTHRVEVDSGTRKEIFHVDKRYTDLKSVSEGSYGFVAAAQDTLKVRGDLTHDALPVDFTPHSRKGTPFRAFCCLLGGNSFSQLYQRRLRSIERVLSNQKF